MSDWEDVETDNDWEDVNHGPSELESFGRGLAQGGLLGLPDEAVGAFKSPSGALKEIANKFGADFSDEDIEAYRKERDDSRKNFKLAEEANPLSYGAGQVTGGLATLVVPGGGAATLGKLATRGAMEGAAYGLGASEAEGAVDLGIDAAKGAGLGAVAGAAGAGLIKGAQQIPKMVPSVGKFAEKWAVNATGATGKESAKFADDAGRELLDRGIVGFGNSQSQIAAKAGTAVDAANAQIDDALKALEQQGVNVDANTIYNTVAKKIKELAADPSQADVAKQLENELMHLMSATEAKGSTDFAISAAEKVKRGYNRKAGNWMDPEKGAVGKEMYQTWRGAVEDAALKVDPAISKSFLEGKKTFGLLRPIEEAAERRAATTAQSPVGGFLDVASGAVAAGSGAGLPAAMAAPVARRIISPRIASSVAVGADKLSKVLSKNPQSFGKYAAVLSKAAQRGGNSLAASHYVLQNSDPEYREQMKSIFNDGND